MVDFILRSARQADARAIKSLIRSVRINPLGLDWRRFVVASTPGGRLIGCGQIKIHSGDVRELASLAVADSYRNQGVASAILAQLLADAKPPVYLICRSALGPFYQRFGFKTMTLEAMPPYFQRLIRLAKRFMPVELLVMVR